MGLIEYPNEIGMNEKVVAIIYGQPGTGKTTLISTAPNPVVIDADKGMHRVERRFQAPRIKLKKYEDILGLLKTKELDGFETLVFDTLGELTVCIMDYLIRTNRGASGGRLNQAGWGYLIEEFISLYKMLETLNKHIIFIAHEDKADNGYITPLASGKGSYIFLEKKVDIIGYISMRGKQRTISFSPDGGFSAKNSLGLPVSIDIPNPSDKGYEHNFIEKQLIAAITDKRTEQQQENEEFERFVADKKAEIKQVESALQATAIANSLNEGDWKWDSSKILKRVLLDRTKELGFTYNKEAKEFEAPAKEPGVMSKFKFRFWWNNTKTMSSHESIVQDINILINHHNAGHGTLMQSTGLRDCEGNLIYEGDIVKWVDDSNLIGGNIKIVEYKNCEIEPICKAPIGKCWKILGNIYENKKLLEGDKSRIEIIT